MRKKTLFVANLDNGISETELAEQFSYFGNIRFINLVEDKRIAFVRMYSSSDAERARLGLNGVELNGHRIRVMEARSR